MTKPARVSCSRGSIPVLSLLLFGLAGAAACSGGSQPKPAARAADAGAARADAGTAASSVHETSEQSLALVRRLGDEHPALKHVAVESPSGLRLHGPELIPKIVDPSKPFIIDAEVPSKYTEPLRVWPIGKKKLSLSLRPLVGAATAADATDDGHAVYRDVYGDTDVIRSLDDSALHETIILRDANSPEYMNWELALGEKTFHPVEVDGGEIVLVDADNVGRLKISSVTLVGADGAERKAQLSLVGSELGLHFEKKGLTYPLAATFSISTPQAGEQFVTAPVQIKGRLLVILDTSGSMTWQFGSNTATNADGDSRAVYCDNNLGSNGGSTTYGFSCGANVPCSTANGGRPDFRLANAVTTPSRMYAAKQALTNVVTAHSGLLDFGLERYAEDSGCPNSTYCCTPATGNTTAGRCQYDNSYYFPFGLPGTSNLTYGGSCGSTSGGGVVLVQPSATSGAAILPWVDQVEDFCSDGTGKPRNPELRATGNTPLARAVLSAANDWYTPIYQASKVSPNPASPLYDPLIDCRSYVLVVMTDGDDTCNGNQSCSSSNPCAAGQSCTGNGSNRHCTCATDADCKTNYTCQSGTCSETTPSQRVAQLRAVSSTNPVTIYTLGMGNASGLNTTELNAMQTNGGSGQTVAPIAANQVDIEAAFADIVSRTVKYEVCNNADDNCNSLIDEGLGVYQECSVAGDCGSGTCDHGRCTCSSNAQCASGNTCGGGFCHPSCSVGVGACARGGVNKCSGGSNACCVNDGAATCTPLTAGTPGKEVCNGIDDDCNGIIDDVPGGCQGCVATPEICNGVDDDCNGIIDDNLTDINKQCGSNIGVCTYGLTKCVNVGLPGATLQCQGGNTGSNTDTCNGLDDNCDGVVDGNTRACYTGPSGTQGVGICRGGTQQCTAVLGSGVEAWGACIGQVLPGTETCNGLDDDCNGKIDDVAGVGASCCPGGKCGVGICKAGTQQCSGGSLQCVGAVSPGTEVCNGLDDDCNGKVDDVATVGNSCCPGGNCGTGVCTSGTIVCQGTQLVCQNSTGPSSEICDGKDNDCNGNIDDVPGKGQSCCPPNVSCGVGICKPGSLQCPAAGGALSCTGFTGPGTEVCNGLDDDCNGIVDDVPGSGTSCCTSGKCGTGVCVSGTKKCVGSTLSCVGEVLPGTEICDQIDNDCNGTTDDVSGAGGACCPYKDSTGKDLCGTGICLPGNLVCVPGKTALQCQNAVGPVPEICDGLDNDCNGIKDDLPGGTVGGTCCPSGRCGTGICKAGMLNCGPTGIECIGAQNPQGEICNGLDDDCNGITDDIPGLGEACCPSKRCGTGVCKAGTLTCAKSGPAGQETYSLTCSGGTDATTEICDGLDNDCNGIIDDVDGLGDPCCPEGSPAGTAPDACNKGVCRPGNLVCDTTKHALVCSGGHGPDPNLCDGIDNNCNGQIDEDAELKDDPQIGVACDAPKAPADNPPCKAGVTICRGTKPVCDGAKGPTDETCDGIDNNCDGMVDNEAPCPSKSDKCIAGSCRSPCQGNEFVRCPGGFVCYQGYCVPPGTTGAGGSGNTGGASGASGSGNAGKSGASGSENAGGTGQTADGGNAGGAGGSSATGPDSGTGANGNGTGASGNGTGANGNAAGTTGSTSTRDVYGLATGGGGCACRTSTRGRSSREGLALVLLLGLSLSVRRRGRRAA